jgi:multiple sugar transport system permease protein
MFQYSESHSGLGYAATIAWVLGIVILIVTLVQWRLSKKWVFYNEENG